MIIRPYTQNATSAKIGAPMNILMIYPKMPPTYWTMDHLMEIMGKRASYPPMGLLTVAGMLPKDWNKKLIDLNVLDYNVGDDLAPILTDELIAWADYAFVGAMNVQAKSAQHVIDHCKARGLKVVAGGPLFTHEHERMRGVDHFILNEAEITLPRFLADLAAGDPKPLYATEEFADVRETPIPQWDLVNKDDYAYAIVQYSRGCPYMCDFCDVTALFGRKQRMKSPEQIIAELEAMGTMSKLGMILFADDNLIGNRKHLREGLLPALIDWRARTKPPVGFATQVTINLIDDVELAQQMLEAGFRHIFCGIETPDEEALLASQKKQNLRRDLLDNVHRLHRMGFIVNAGFIVGFDNDTPAGYERMVDFIQKSGIVNATVNMLKAPPGTELFTKMRNAGRLIEPFNFDENESNIIPVMDPKSLLEGYDFVLRNVYTADAVYARTRTFLEGYPGAQIKHPIRRPADLKGILQFVRATWTLGVVDPARGKFWSLMFWALRHNRRFVSVAFLDAALAYQFGRMYEKFDVHTATRNMERAVVEMPLPEAVETVESAAQRA